MLHNKNSHTAGGVLLATILIFAAPTSADEPPGAPGIDWTVGPAQVDLGQHATLQVPTGFRFTGATGAHRFMELNHNPSDGSTLGVMIPPIEQFASTEGSWFITFSFNGIGYVKDDEKGDLDADAILKSLRQGTEQANIERRRRGWATLTVQGWQQQPFYDPQTHNLTWAIRGSSEGNVIANYDTRVLGRRGVMQVKMVVSPQRVAATVPTYNMIVSGINFKQGHKYSEYREGDKVAQYTLTGLITDQDARTLTLTGVDGQATLIGCTGNRHHASMSPLAWSCVMASGRDARVDWT